ncbi:hypothetical protein RKLH11_2409 [Rhodobacteraceae bacterium KLH11]|nr:hypothetical protein RKLH11_2409 [Rhodobacteraceae bacterium KLH11]
MRYRLVIGQVYCLCCEQHLLFAPAAAPLRTASAIPNCSGPCHCCATHICNRNRGIPPNRYVRESATRLSGGPMRLRRRHRQHGRFQLIWFRAHRVSRLAVLPWLSTLRACTRCVYER